MSCYVLFLFDVEPRFMFEDHDRNWEVVFNDAMPVSACYGTHMEGRWSGTEKVGEYLPTRVVVRCFSSVDWPEYLLTGML